MINLYSVSTANSSWHVDFVNNFSSIIRKCVQRWTFYFILYDLCQDPNKWHLFSSLFGKHSIITLTFHTAPTMKNKNTLRWII